MRKVITVSLNGVAYQLEEAAYDAVLAYLAQAERALAGNPDRAEILSDLEQAISDKCDTFLGKQKNVVLAPEAQRILAEMGPVDGAPAGPTHAGGDGGEAHRAPADAGTARSSRRRLFRLPSEGMLGGVCAGLAAWFGLDAVWMRLGFIVLTLFTGVWFFVWLALLIVMPAARTPEQIASARGESLSAREVMDLARRKSAELGRAAAAGVEDAGRNLRETFGRG